MMGGNYDYDLACDANFATKLQAYNIYLDESLVLTGTVGDKKSGSRTDSSATNSMLSPTMATPCCSATLISEASRMRRQAAAVTFMPPLKILDEGDDRRGLSR
jgi:hypothetical protein